jgi:phospholipase C
MSEGKMLGDLLGHGVGTAMGLALAKSVNDRSAAVGKSNLQSWKDYAAELQQANVEWSAYAKKLAEYINWLEDNLKRQSANRAGLNEVYKMVLEELKLFADPQKAKTLDVAMRQKAFDAKFQQFMNGDQLAY